MASRRCLQALALSRQAANFLSSTSSISVPPFLRDQSIKSTLASPIFIHKTSVSLPQWFRSRYFSSGKKDDHANKGVSDVEGNDEGNDDDDDDDDDDYDEDEEDYEGESAEDDDVVVSGRRREYTAEEKESEAAAIGYKVVGPLAKEDRVFKPYESVFAVVQIGSHQFKVSNGDCIFTERLKFCQVNDKLVLNKVLLLGSPSQTIIGRPMLPDAAVHAVVEEHALDAKVIIFKKKRRKNYRRTKGHRQELTKLRITGIQGIEKPENVPAEKPSKAAKKEQGKAQPSKSAEKKQEKVAVTA